MEENQDYTTILGSGNACPYINSLANGGAWMTNSYGCGHQSEDNYDSLFFGNPENGYGDPCPNNVGAIPSLGNSLIQAGYGFCGYTETLPSAGSTVCTSGNYALKHSPWIQALVSAGGNLPVTCDQPFTAFPTNYSTLPTVSFVIPNLIDDMHSATPASGDTWLNTNLSAYATYCQTASNNSLLIVQWDEDATGGAEGNGTTVGNTSDNHIATIFYGAGVITGQYPESGPINHYNILNTILSMYNLAQIGDSVGVAAITDIF
jgi:acid phosphatase